MPCSVRQKRIQFLIKHSGCFLNWSWPPSISRERKSSRQLPLGSLAKPEICSQRLAKAGKGWQRLAVSIVPVVISYRRIHQRATNRSFLPVGSGQCLYIHIHFLLQVPLLQACCRHVRKCWPSLRQCFIDQNAQNKIIFGSEGSRALISDTDSTYNRTSC